MKSRNRGKHKQGKAIAWVVGATWAATAGVVTFLYFVRPTTTVHVSLLASDLSLPVRSARLFTPSNDVEVVVSEVERLEVFFTANNSDAGTSPASSVLVGGSGTSCFFSSTRSSPITLKGDATIRIRATNTANQLGFSVTSDVPMSGELTSQPASGTLRPTYRCVGKAVPERFEAEVPSDKTAAILYLTASNAAISVAPSAQAASIGSALEIVQPFKIAEVDAVSGEETSALLEGRSVDTNFIIFESLGRKVSLDYRDIIQIAPGGRLRLRGLSVDHGIHADLHGVVSNVRRGSGVGDMETIMPRALDYCLNAKGMLGLIPALVTLVLGILERMHVLPLTKS
jgi:hypothetical protein